MKNSLAKIASFAAAFSAVPVVPAWAGNLAVVVTGEIRAARNN